MKKNGQIKLSFAMIFSIILIIIFIAFAIYGIMKFLELQRNVQIGQFLDEIQNDVDKIWKSSQGSQTNEYRLPTKIKSICFADFYSSKKGLDADKYNELKLSFYEFENLVFYPVGSSEISAYNLKHINITETTKTNNPLCFENNKGKLILNIQMNPGDSLVTISR